MKTRWIGWSALSIVAAATVVLAQQAAPPLVPANPSPGCKATPAELDANKKVALMFFQTQGDARVALADPSYKQHNPAFVKGRQEAGSPSDYEYFKSRFGGPPPQAGAPAARGVRGGVESGPGAGGRGPGAAPQPPPGNPSEVVTAECDIVTVVHKNFRQDPTAAPGTWYEVFTFDTFRVRNGKLVEHWDGAVINPPAPGRGN